MFGYFPLYREMPFTSLLFNSVPHIHRWFYLNLVVHFFINVEKNVLR